MSVLTQDPPQTARPDPNPTQFTPNAKPVTVVDELERSLLGVLREDFGATSLKNGCEPQASCGCCTLLIDGKPRLSCTMKASQVAGKALVDIEGVTEEKGQKNASSVATCGGGEVGLCHSGMAHPR